MSLPSDILSRYPGAETFRFGDSGELNMEILALVGAGDKTVACDALAASEAYLTRAGLYAPDVMLLVERFEVVEAFADV